eukprot:1399591-Alexandrium_andersonii.AAC.1
MREGTGRPRARNGHCSSTVARSHRPPTCAGSSETGSRVRLPRGLPPTGPLTHARAAAARAPMSRPPSPHHRPNTRASRGAPSAFRSTPSTEMALA